MGTPRGQPQTNTLGFLGVHFNEVNQSLVTEQLVASKLPDCDSKKTSLPSSPGALMELKRVSKPTSTPS